MKRIESLFARFVFTIDYGVDTRSLHMGIYVVIFFNTFNKKMMIVIFWKFVYSFEKSNSIIENIIEIVVIVIDKILRK